MATDKANIICCRRIKCHGLTSYEPFVFTNLVTNTMNSLPNIYVVNMPKKRTEATAIKHFVRKIVTEIKL